MTIRMKCDTKEVQSALAELFRKQATLKPFFEIVWPVLHRSIMANFRMGGRPDRWQYLADSTINARKKRKTWREGVGSDQPILQEYGTLRERVGNVLSMTDTRLEYGIRDDRAGRLQFGDKKRHLPARPFIMFQDEDIDRVAAMAAGYAFGIKK